jgi:hypothetical protein
VCWIKSEYNTANFLFINFRSSQYYEPHHTESASCQRVHRVRLVYTHKESLKKSVGLVSNTLGMHFKRVSSCFVTVMGDQTKHSTSCACTNKRVERLLTIIFSEGETINSPLINTYLFLKGNSLSSFFY